MVRIFLIVNLIAIFTIFGTVSTNKVLNHDVSLRDLEATCNEFSNSCQIPYDNHTFEARKKKKGQQGGGGDNIQIVSTNDHDDSESYEIIETLKKGKSKKGRRKKKKEGKQGKKKYMKHMTPIAITALALKVLFQHFLIKKLALMSALSFLLSKTSFILSALLALKQLFHTGHQEKSDNPGKLEVVHIPIRKKHPDFHEREIEKDYSQTPWLYRQDESQILEDTFENIIPEESTHRVSFNDVPNAFESPVNYNYK